MKLMLKILLVLGLSLAILIPLLLIRGTIQDRQQHRASAVAQIARSEAGAQALSAPVLVVPWTQPIEVEEKDAQGQIVRRVQRSSGQWEFFPQTSTFTAKMAPYSRRLGLHEIRMYALAGQLSAEFEVAIPADANPALPRTIGRPYLSYGIADVRGLRGAPQLRVDGAAVVLQQSAGEERGSGVHAELPRLQAGTTLRLRSALDLDLSGAEALAFVPLAEQNRIVIDSRWPHPQFNGAFLPRNRTVDDSGFHAEWDISALATNAQAQYRNGARMASENVEGLAAYNPGIDALGLSLVDPVNPYVQADRASKYGILFVVLTFVGFFMFELIKQLRIHAIQYGLVGLALAIFFLLLVGLSEHIAFGWAYLIASVACIGLLGFYLSHVLRSRARGLGFAAMLTLLYGALYGLLVSEDNALVLGAGLLFAILAALMIVTRRVDWYQAAATPARPVPPALP